MATVSVVIPTRDRLRMLERAVASVLNQTWRDFELIVVDDGSTESVGGFHDPRVRVIRQDGRGVAAARNAGIRAAGGEWIAFLDDDDEWLERKLDAQMALIAARPQTRAVQTREIWMRRGRRVNPRPVHEQPDGLILPRSLHLCIVSPSSVMIHRAVFDEIGLFDESLPACEDYDLWLRLGLRHPVALVREPLIVKNGGRSDQLSAAPGLDRYRIAALKKFIDDPMSEPYRAEAAQVLAEKCRVYAGGCRKRGREDEAREYERLIEAQVLA